MPYSNKPSSAFWKLCRDSSNFLSDNLFTPKHHLSPGNRIATAGSCFAQNIGRYIRASDLELIDVEPEPMGMSVEDAKAYGFGLFSARYGNIYTARQLLQLLTDSVTGQVHSAAIWEKGGAIFDGLRPGIEPEGYGSVRELKAHRKDHLYRVSAMFAEADMFVFTLGLTEAWQDSATGLVFPSVPGVIAGTFDPSVHSFVNLGFGEVMEDMRFVIEFLRDVAPKIQVMLTVSPVPLTATASDGHVLSATSYSKSVLRAVAGELAATEPMVDYFPSYELITGAPFASQSYNSNLRTVRTSAVDRVMSVFFGSYPELDAPDLGQFSEMTPQNSNEMDEEDALICEEVLLEAFADK